MRKLLLAGMTVLAMTFTVDANADKGVKGFDFMEAPDDVGYYSKSDMGVFAADVDLSGWDLKDFPKIAIGRSGGKDLEKVTVGGDMPFEKAIVGGDTPFEKATVGGDTPFEKATVGGDTPFEK